MISRWVAWSVGWVAMRAPLPSVPLPAPTRASAVSGCAPNLDAELHGRACSPSIPAVSSWSEGGGEVLVRYMFDGGTLAQGRLCVLSPAADDVVQGVELLAALQRDGVE